MSRRPPREVLRFPPMPEQDELRGNAEQSVPPVSVDVRSLPQRELQTLARQLLSSLEADGVAIAIAIPAVVTSMICTVNCGEIAPPVGALLDVNSGISGLCIREKRTLHSPDTTIDLRVDKEACDRLGIRSVVVSPLLRDSTCIGVLEVFSAKVGAFDEADLTNVEQAAVRAASLIKLELPAAESQAHSSQRSNERPGLFLVNKRVQLPPREPGDRKIVERNAFGNQESFATPKFLSLSPSLEQPGRWIKFAAAGVAAAILGFVLIRYMSSSATVPKNSSSATALVARESAKQELPTISSIVSDAAPEVRILMAKAIAGNSTAQASLAERYTAGDGVTRDPVKAAVWYVVAGVSGNKQASRSAIGAMQNLQSFEINQVHFNLGTMFRDGIGTSPDLIAAYSWFSLADTAGDVRAAPALLNLEQVMKPTEITESKRRAAAWLESHHTAASPQLR